MTDAQQGAVRRVAKGTRMVPVLLRRAERRAAIAVVGLGTAALLVAVAQCAAALPAALHAHALTVLVVVACIALGELASIRMPSGRETAPLSSASAMAVVLLGPIAEQPVFDIDAGVVVLLVTAGLLLTAAVRRVRHRTTRAPELAARVVGVALAAVLTREVGDPTLWDAETGDALPRGVVVIAMALVAAVGLLTELVLASAVRSERQRSPWWTALRDEVGEAAPLTLAVIATGPMVAFMAPVLGLFALPAALVPLAIAYSAVRQYARNRETNRQLIGTLSHLTEHGGYTPEHHARRVAAMSVRLGRSLGLDEETLRDLEYAALLHDLGQISLLEPIPGGATVLAAPADQRDIADEGARIIRAAGGLDDVAALVEAQTTAYRLVRELDHEVPMAARIIKAANAFDDLTAGSHDPEDIDAAMERINLGLGYEYDPDVVDALAQVVLRRAGRRSGSRSETRTVAR
ncbi:MAG: HD-GYP domain-containing protein [Dermatophilaceae bacterium]